LWSWYYVYSYIGYVPWEISLNGGYRVDMWWKRTFDTFLTAINFTVTGIPAQLSNGWLPVGTPRILSVSRGAELSNGWLPVGTPRVLSVQYEEAQPLSNGWLSVGTPFILSVSRGAGLSNGWLSVGTPFLLSVQYGPAPVLSNGWLAVGTARILSISRGPALSNGWLPVGTPKVITIAGLVLTVSTTSLADGVVGAAYSQTLKAVNGIAPYSWSIASGTLPAGLTLSSAGVISGTPTAAGNPVSVTFKVTDSVGATATKVLSITVKTVAGKTNWLPYAIAGGAAVVVGGIALASKKKKPSVPTREVARAVSR
jgi:hypothetical protein